MLGSVGGRETKVRIVPFVSLTDRIAARPPVKFEIDVFTPIFLRDLYVRADSDRDGRIEMDEVCCV